MRISDWSSDVCSSDLPHIFHTNSQEIFDYLSRFTRWRPYEHRVLAAVDDLLVPMPINRTTLNMLYGLDLATEEEAAAFLAAQAEPVSVVRTDRKSTRLNSSH